jgi:hypothetical protein
MVAIGVRADMTRASQRTSATADGAATGTSVALAEQIHEPESRRLSTDIVTPRKTGDLLFVFHVEHQFFCIAQQKVARHQKFGGPGL